MKHRRGGQLVCQHLERISRAALEDYKDVVRDFVRGRHGVYALYQKNRLYYVGLASNLRGRLKHHLRDRHSKTWDRFSVYLTVGDQHLRELEALLLRIIAPPGNQVTGKFAKSQDLCREFRRQIKYEQHTELESLLTDGSKERRKATSAGKEEACRTPPLAAHVSRRFPIRFRYKGTLHTATVRNNGKIRFAGCIYNSPSLAASAITKRPMNGWTAWSYERAPGDWVVLDELRK